MKQFADKWWWPLTNKSDYKNKQWTVAVFDFNRQRNFVKINEVKDFECKISREISSRLK